MCVSTAIAICLKAVFSTTLAVLRPTPGKASSASRSAGTTLPWRSISAAQVLMMFSALVLKSPMVLI